MENAAKRCAGCKHPVHAGYVCGYAITETIRDDVGFFGPPSGISRTQIVGTCRCGTQSEGVGGSMIAEMWVDTHGNFYYRLTNWHGFYELIRNCWCCTVEPVTFAQGTSVEASQLPSDCRQLMRDGSLT